MNALLANAMRLHRTGGVHHGRTFGAIVGDPDGVLFVRTYARAGCQRVTPLESAACLVICDALDLLAPDDELALGLDVALAALARLSRNRA